MNYIVFDLEWNQGSTYKDKQQPKMPFEIVEIGAVRLDETMQKTGSFHRLVRPQVYRHMHGITKRIIHLSMQDLKEGDPFPEVAAAFEEFCGEECRFVTWGASDLTEYQRNLAFYDLPLLKEKPLPYYDVQRIYALSKGEAATRQHSLESAVDDLQIPREQGFHRALSDASYTAQIFAGIPAEIRENQLSLNRYGVVKESRRARRNRNKKAREL